jgi:hypothetical protein
MLRQQNSIEKNSCQHGIIKNNESYDFFAFLGTGPHKEKKD